MGYVKFEHRHLGDDRWLTLSPAAFTVHTWALDHCNEQATDGRIPKARAVRLTCPVAPADLPAAWAELVGAGIWEDSRDHYECPEFLAHGISAEEQTAVRNKWAEDKRRQRLHRNGNHQLCTPRSCKAAAEAAHDATAGEGTTTETVSEWLDLATRLAENGHPSSTDGGMSTGGHEDSGPPVHQQTSGRSDQIRPDSTPKGWEGRGRCPHGAPIAADGYGCARCADEQVAV